MVLNSCSNFYNGGTVSVADVTSVTQEKIYWINNGHYVTGTMMFSAKNTTFYNFCQLIVQGNCNFTDGEFNLMNSSYTECNTGIFKTMLNTVLGKYIKRLAGLSTEKVENRLKKQYKAIGLKITPNGPGKQLITDKYGTVGMVTDKQGERRYTFEAHKLKNHLIQTIGTDKKKAKAEKRDEEKKNRKDQDFIVYSIDDEGNYSPEDYVMSQSATSYDSGKSGYHVNIFLQVFTTDRAYVTKAELKQKKKENKIKMTYRNLLDFERSHHIPALSEAFQKRINEVIKAK